MLAVGVTILSFFFFLVMAGRIAVSVAREGTVLREFDQSRRLAGLVLLFPFGPAALATLPYVTGWLPAALVRVACYVPAFVTGRSQAAALDLSGTDRTDRAQAVAQQAVGIALAGFLYVAVFLIFALSRLGW